MPGGTGRYQKNTDNPVSTNITIPKDLKDLGIEMAKRRGISFSMMISMILKEEIEADSPGVRSVANPLGK